MNKVYKFEVTGLPTENNYDSFINNLLAEAKLENSQAELGIKINKETQEAHKGVMREIMDKLNFVMGQLNLKDKFVKEDAFGIVENGYQKPCTELFDEQLRDLVIQIVVDGKHNDKNFTTTGDFPTYTGHYELNVRLFPPFGNCDWMVLERENCVDNILQMMKPYFKHKLKSYK
jgi:hypothetical protein